MSAPQWGRGGWRRWGSGPDTDPRWDAPRASWDRSRVYRDSARGWLAGVCAGIADYMETDPWLVRVAAVICLIFFFVPTVIAYVAFALVLKPKPPALFGTAEEESFWRGMRGDPGGTLYRLRERFGAVERRLNRAETLVTSDDYDLRRRFRDIGG
ncbi:MAG: envelope stress response membrane protein PspC [Acetobacteraceae bacterium]